MKNKVLLKDKKSIAFVVPSLGVGGAERVVVSLANTLIDKFDVSIYLLYNEKNIFYKLSPEITIRYCNDSLEKSGHFLSAIKNNYRIFSKLKSFSRKDGIEVLIGFTTTCNLMSILVALRNKISSIICDRSNPYFTKLNFFWNTLRYLIYRKCNKLVVQTQHSKNYFNFISNSKIAILPNPLSNDLIQKKDSLAKKKKHILYVARLDSNKAQNVLIKAFANLQVDDWKLILVGDGNKSKYYKRLVQHLNIEERVIFTGKRDDPHFFYNQSKIFAFTSQSEGFPNSLIEAMYFGLPCVSTNCQSGPSELIEDGFSGFLIPVNNVECLTEKLKILIENHHIREKFSLNSTKKANEFLLENVKKKWESIINSV